MKKLSLVLISAALATACAKTEVPAELDTLKSDVDQALETLSGIDSAYIAESFGRLEPYFNHLRTSEFDSSMAEVYISDLTWMDRYQRALSKWQGRVRQNEAVLEESRSQLNALIHDIRYDVIDTANIAEYIRQERLTVQNALEYVQERGGEIQYYSTRVDSMYQRLDSIFPSLQ